MQIREHPGVQGKRDFYPFDPRLLKIDASFNVRDLDAPDERPELDELKQQIRESGVRVPLEIRLVGEDVVIAAGHRRHKVVMELIAEGVEIETVPVIHEPKYINDADRDLGLIISNSGKPLSSLQKAAVVRRLMAHGWDEKKIAGKTGLSVATINNLVKVEALPEAVKEQVKQGDISASLAVKTVNNLPAGTDPAVAAEMIRANKEENKRFGVGAKNNHKVTPKTINRGKKDARPFDEPAPDPKPMDSPPPPILGVSQDQTAMDRGSEAGVAEHDGVTQAFTAATDMAVRAYESADAQVIELVKVLASLATEAREVVSAIEVENPNCNFGGLPDAIRRADDLIAQYAVTGGAS